MVHLSSSSDVKLFDIFELRNKIGDKRCLGLPFFHAFTGCDSTSSFFQHGKCKFWDTWLASNESLTDTFIDLSNQPTSISDEDFKLIQVFLMKVYCHEKYTTFLDINDARIKSFFQSPDPKL